MEEEDPGIPTSQLTIPAMQPPLPEAASLSSDRVFGRSSPGAVGKEGPGARRDRGRRSPWRGREGERDAESRVTKRNAVPHLHRGEEKGRDLRAGAEPRRGCAGALSPVQPVPCDMGALPLPPGPGSLEMKLLDSGARVTGSVLGSCVMVDKALSLSVAPCPWLQNGGWGGGVGSSDSHSQGHSEASASPVCVSLPAGTGRSRHKAASLLCLLLCVPSVPAWPWSLGMGQDRLAGAVCGDSAHRRGVLPGPNQPSSCRADLAGCGA